ncbi:MAG: phosphatidate cytidylyltransferase [Phycisphaerales bacterium]|nr:phosphatidate cytidylyltransferase [Phycisphaerales bacterium]
MRERLLLGPVLIAALLGVLALDEWLTGLETPSLLAGVLGTALPAGVLVLPVMLLAAALAARELTSFVREKGAPVSGIVMGVAPVCGLLAWAAGLATEGTLGLVVLPGAGVVVLVLAMLVQARKQDSGGALAATGGALLSFAYLGLAFGFLLAIRAEHSAWVLLWVLLVTKACDIGAYFTGKSIGRRKLIPWLSPGKTWEGLGGGVVLSAAVGAGGLAMLGAWAGVEAPPWWMGAACGAVLGLVGQAGDLAESMMKRDAGIKDSGSILPGFGGMLDVLDSPIFVAPVAYGILAGFRAGGWMGAVPL